MPEYTLENVIDEVLRRDFAPFDEPCEHRFSLRHRRRMKKIFSESITRFEKTSARIPVKKRLVIALALVLLMALAGLSAAASFGGSFTDAFVFMKNATGTTAVVSLDQINENNFISDIYKLGEPPEGYAYDEYIGSLDNTFTIYKNDAEDILIMMQCVKEKFLPEYDSSFSGFTETKVGGMSCYYLTRGEFTELVWDNGEYVFELNGKLSAEELTEAAESMCIDTNYRMGIFTKN